MATSPVRRIFLPSTFFGGVVAVLLGCAGLYAQFLSDLFVSDAGTWRISIWLVVICGLLVLGGLGAMIGAFFGRGCTSCNVALDDDLVTFHEQHYPALTAAVERAKGGDTSALVALRPYARHEGTERVAALECRVCPRCKNVGEFTATVKAWSTGEQPELETHTMGATAQLTGPAVAQVMTLKLQDFDLPGAVSQRPGAPFGAPFGAPTAQPPSPAAYSAPHATPSPMPAPSAHQPAPPASSAWELHVSDSAGRLSALRAASDVPLHVGSDPRCELAVADPTLPPVAFVLYVRADGAWIEPRAALWLNGASVAEARPLRAEDQLAAGQCWFALRPAQAR